jgi:hypothetical protein
VRRTHRRFEHSLRVRAPRDIVWAVASARDVTLDGVPPIVIQALPSPQEGVEILEIRAGDKICRVGLRLLARRMGVSEMHAVVPEHSDHLAAMTGVTATGFELTDVPGGTRLALIQEGCDMGLGARIRAPVALRLMGRRMATASELAAAMRRPRPARRAA